MVLRERLSISLIIDNDVLTRSLIEWHDREIEVGCSLMTDINVLDRWLKEWCGREVDAAECLLKRLQRKLNGMPETASDKKSCTCCHHSRNPLGTVVVGGATYYQSIRCPQHAEEFAATAAFLKSAMSAEDTDSD